MRNARTRSPLHRRCELDSLTRADNARGAVIARLSSTSKPTSLVEVLVARSLYLRLLLLFSLSLAFTGCGPRKRPQIDPNLARLIEEKRAQARELAAAQTYPVPGKVWKLLDALQVNDWRRATNIFNDLKEFDPDYSSYDQPPPQGPGAKTRLLFEAAFGTQRSPPPSALFTAVWCPIVEAFGAGEVFHDWDDGLLHRFGNDIINSIPTNSIYFGGTDPGRFAVTALSQSHRGARPFFTLTQNSLADQ